VGVFGAGPGLAAERGPDALLEPDAMAEMSFRLRAQPRRAWTLELDVRLWAARFRPRNRRSLNDLVWARPRSARLDQLSERLAAEAFIDLAPFGRTLARGLR
jgi:hypothetical protein